jgi:hypothetical protein
MNHNCKVVILFTLSLFLLPFISFSQGQAIGSINKGMRKSIIEGNFAPTASFAITNNGESVLKFDITQSLVPEGPVVSSPAISIPVNPGGIITIPIQDLTNNVQNTAKQYLNVANQNLTKAGQFVVSMVPTGVIKTLNGVILNSTPTISNTFITGTLTSGTFVSAGPSGTVTTGNGGANGTFTSGTLVIKGGTGGTVGTGNDPIPVIDPCSHTMDGPNGPIVKPIDGVWMNTLDHEGMYICPFKKVGIYNSSPSYELDVTGDIHGRNTIIDYDSKVGHLVSVGRFFNSDPYFTDFTTNNLYSGLFDNMVNVGFEKQIPGVRPQMKVFADDRPIAMLIRSMPLANSTGTFTALKVQAKNDNVLLMSLENTDAKYTGDNSTRFLVKGNGDTYINGIVRTKELFVKEDIWADYVFAKGYKMMTLKELSAYIKTNKHLPNIPSAKEVEGKEVSVNVMLQKQMEKIEELTLYMIKQQEEIDALKKQLNKK